MAGILLSHTEKVYITHGVKNEYRSDGRSNIDYRPMELETDVVSHASGSARLRLANTDILVGVKTEIDVPKPDKPGLGKIEFFVDCSANATPEFEGRGGEQLANSISNIMLRAYQSAQAFNLKQLCIFEGKQCWKLYIDILILECGGNLCDAVSLAVKAALFNTRIPFVKAALMDGGNVDLQLSDDPFDSKWLDVGSAPLLVTLCRIGEKCVVDPTAEEESCSLVSLIVGVTGNPKYYNDYEDEEELPAFEAKCSVISMHGPGSVSPQNLRDAINQGIIAAVCLDEALGKTLFRERRDTEQFKRHSYGFLK
ncbi:exosome complex component RRP42 isoform X1 [Bicyclus anynana]|uniref:Ribosomal RNA-processing protein 42 n=1 Tax=Bicyclus anynana TaxID=110368 RepID=A0A6J1NR84_BICAN|nr:exosome complex component RRP42 isoform X1 [Bicyclus anynana]